ncbi:MAG: LL-diaminopimelate aminotransferase [Oscillospiraceae bacterium]|nr:LL-diaminopimelate aminotransferase [Oscillospiraceae bacterium]
MNINTNFLKLKDSYLFSTIARKIASYSKANPEKKIIRMGIGDVTLPLCKAVIDEMQAAVCEMGNKQTFRGYGPEQGYDFLAQKICEYYARLGTQIERDEVFISDGAKSDIGNILDLFSVDNTVLIPDPVYPVYVDTNIIAGHNIIYMDATAENEFLPMPDQNVKADLIYLCSPNNPTGAVYNRQQLKEWVDYALNTGAVILFDAAYEAFISDDSLPKSIFEIEGAKRCAIEFCSLSKTAGFTGTRCGYTVVPMALEKDGTKLNRLWLRRQTTKFNGVPYIVQRGAAAVFTQEGQSQIKQNINYYLGNAKIIADALQKKGIWFTGGHNSPYIWLKCPNNMGSWDYFDFLLENAQVAGTPGAGFGKNGEGYFRLSAFGDRDDTHEAVKRILSL